MSERPVLVGSMFYQSDDVVLDAATGSIDEAKALRRMKKTEGLAEEHGISFIMDIEIPSLACAPAIIEVVKANSRCPLWISSFDAEMRLKACEMAVSEGLKDRIYYSTLNYMSDEAEFRAVAAMGLRPVVQVFNPEDPFPDGYMAKAEELLARARAAGTALEDMVLLPTVLDFGSIPLSMATIHRLKAKYNLPVCVTSVGPVYKWAGDFSVETRRLLLASILTYTVSAGADLVHMGSIKRAFITFPVLSLLNTLEDRKESLDLS